MNRGIWEDWLNLVLGAWLIIAPFLGVGGANQAAIWNSYAVGVLVLVFAWVALSRPHRWEEMINLVLGIWLIISPFILGYSYLRGSMWSHVVIGAVIGIDALLAMRSPVHYRPVS